MTGEFDPVRDAFARSLAGRALAASEDAIARAWRSSAARRQIQASVARLGIRAVAIAIAVAALAQVALIPMMPRTVAPVISWWAYATVALLAMIVAVQADAIAASWPASRLRKMID